jgi:hypothetical protein
MALGLRKKITNYQFCALFSHIYLIFGTLLCHTYIQIKFEFGSDPLIFHEVMALGLRKKSRIVSFSLLTVILFSLNSYSFDIWYIALPHQDTD